MSHVHIKCSSIKLENVLKFLSIGRKTGSLNSPSFTFLSEGHITVDQKVGVCYGLLLFRLALFCI